MIVNSKNIMLAKKFSKIQLILVVNIKKDNILRFLLIIKLKKNKSIITGKGEIIFEFDFKHKNNNLISHYL